jgi:hypothetical protein
MRNFSLRLLKGFDYHSALDFGQSLLPSHKYSLSIIFMVMSSIIVPIDKWFGLDFTAFVALMVVFTTELISGIIASRIRKEQFSSMKLSRFSFKVAIYLVLIFVPYAFKNSFKAHDQSVPTWVFDWMHIFLLTHIVIENLVSILENLAVITGSDKTAWINKIQDVLANAFSSTSIPTNDDNK